MEVDLNQIPSVLCFERIQFSLSNNSLHIDRATKYFTAKLYIKCHNNRC